MNGKHVIFVLGCKEVAKVTAFAESMKNCVYAVPKEGFDGLEDKMIYAVRSEKDLDKVFSSDANVDNIVFHYLIDSKTECEPVSVLLEMFQCVKFVYRELLLHRNAKVWFALLPEFSSVPERRIVNSGIKSLSQIIGFEVEKRKIPVNCISLEKNDNMDKIRVLLEYSTDNPIYLNLQTI